MRSTPGCIFLLPLKSRIAEVIARPTLHPGVGHIHRNAIAIAALDPRTTAQRHLNVPLLAAGGVHHAQISRLHFRRRNTY